MDEQKASVLRSAFGISTTAAAKSVGGSPRDALNPKQQAEYDKLIKKGMTPKQAAAFAKNTK